jgi:hypothetical protein
MTIVTYAHCCCKLIISPRKRGARFGDAPDMTRSTSGAARPPMRCSATSCDGCGAIWDKLPIYVSRPSTAVVPCCSSQTCPCNCRHSDSLKGFRPPDPFAVAFAVCRTCSGLAGGSVFLVAPLVRGLARRWLATLPLGAQCAFSTSFPLPYFARRLQAVCGKCEVGASVSL